jgi:hypothetical protein
MPLTQYRSVEKKALTSNEVGTLSIAHINMTKVTGFFRWEETAILNRQSVIVMNHVLMLTELSA